MRKLLRPRKTRSSWPKSKRCRYRRPKTVKLRKNPVTSTRSSWTTWWTKTFDWKNSCQSLSIVPSAQRRSYPRQRIRHTREWWINPTISIWTTLLRIRTMRNLAISNRLLSEWTTRTVSPLRCSCLSRWLYWGCFWWHQVGKDPI
jgi:hypothetical protein